MKISVWVALLSKRGYAPLLNNCLIFLKFDLYIIGETVGKDERFWKDPQQFKPERFLEEYNNYAYLPFSAGQRFLMI